MEHRIVGPGPYRATKLWNETVELFRTRMPLRKHRCRFKSYEHCFTAAEAVDWLHELLRCSQNFGPEVTRKQTVQLLKKFLKNHVIEDIKGKWGQEDFEDNRHLYRFPPSSPLKPYPKKPPYQKDVIKFPEWNDPPAGTSQENIPVRPVVMNSEMWYKRHSIAIGEVPACRLVYRRQLTEANVEEIWKSMTLSYLQKILGLDSLEEILDIKLVNSKFIIHNVYSVSKQGVVILDDKSKELPHWVLSAMKCLANCLLPPLSVRPICIYCGPCAHRLSLLASLMARAAPAHLSTSSVNLLTVCELLRVFVPTPGKGPNCSDLKQPMYLGFEKDVFKTIADYYGHLKEPLLTFHLFDAFVSVLGLLQKEKMAIEAFQICCLLLPPENRRKLQLLMRMMTRICLNKEMPPLCDGFGTRTLMVQTFSRCILCSKDEVDLDELLAARLVTFLMDNYQEILKVPVALQTSIEERVAHLRRVQIKYPGADMDITLSAPSFCRQISPEEFEYQRAYGSQEPLAALLEDVITDAKLSSKEKKKKLKQFQKSYPEVYQERFPTPESEALLFPEKPKPKPQLLLWALKNPFQPFQRTRSFRM
uniref:DEP domain-containing protein 1B n=1 Tax=Equus asinus TaxID=9793 RepID=A0A9L0JIC9_EQUAS